MGQQKKVNFACEGEKGIASVPPAILQKLASAGKITFSQEEAEQAIKIAQTPGSNLLVEAFTEQDNSIPGGKRYLSYKISIKSAPACIVQRMGIITH